MGFMDQMQRPVRFGPQFDYGGEPQQDDGASVLRDLGVGQPSAPQEDPEYAARMQRNQDTRQHRGDIMAQLDQMLSQPRPQQPNMKPSFMQTMGMAALPGLGQVFASNRMRPYQQAMEQRQGGIEDLTARLGLYPDPGENNYRAGGQGAIFGEYGNTKLLPQQPGLPPNPWDTLNTPGGFRKRNADNTDWEFVETDPDRSRDYASEGTSFGYRMRGINRYEPGDPRYAQEEKVVGRFRQFNQTEDESAEERRVGDGAAKAEREKIESKNYGGATLTPEQEQQISRARFAAIDSLRAIMEQRRAAAANPHALNPGGAVSTGNPDMDAYLQEHPEMLNIPPDQRNAAIKARLLAEEGAGGGGQRNNPPSPWLQNPGEPQFDPNDFSSYMRRRGGSPTP